MKSKALLTMFSAGLLASTAFPALAGGDLEKQLQMTDGYTEPSAAPATGAGAAGRSGAATHKGNAADHAWSLKQLQQTDGYTAPAVVPALRIGAAGRPGKSTDDAWFQRQLRLSGGN